MEAGDIVRKHVIVALDLDDIEEAMDLVDRLGSAVDKFKVGSKMFTRYGPRVLDELGSRGRKVFLDLKFHDIPSVVEGAVAQAAEHEAVFMLTVHAVGGSQMVASAVAGAKRRREQPPHVVAVTALTSLSPAETRLLGVELSLDEWATKLAELAIEAGADGVVSSANEVRELRRRLGDEVLYVTPGIRPSSWQQPDDQSRVMTPKEALNAGSSFLVIGRPVYRADDPLDAIESIAEGLR